MLRRGRVPSTWIIPDISGKILERKRKNIEKTGADVVVTGCPGCLIQLTKASVIAGWGAGSGRCTSAR